jgi:hypothetical protein
MADGDYVEPLTGEEIITDLCCLLADKLRKDCNLRDADSYQGGYSAKVTVHLEAYGMDTANVDVEVAAGKPKDDPDEVIDTTLDVPAEAALDQVRERSDQPVPTLAMDDGQQVVRPRRYIRRERVVGGATGEELP